MLNKSESLLWFHSYWSHWSRVFSHSFRVAFNPEELRWPGHPEKARFAMFKNLPADCI